MVFKKILFLITFLTLGVVACSDNSTKVNEPSLSELYNTAVNDAIIVSEDEVANDLIAIKPENNSINYRSINGKNYVLALTLTPYVNSYIVGDTIETSWGEIWLTVVPEIKNFYKNKIYQNDSILQLRLLQNLGMPVSNRKYYFVEMWVDPDSLFRPTPDEEITDSKTDLYFPEDATESHKIWFNNQILNSYFPIATNANKYPWTRLGYTYNWTFGEKERGFSEFVLRKNSKVIVQFAGTPAEYLHP